MRTALKKTAIFSAMLAFIAPMVTSAQTYTLLSKGVPFISDAQGGGLAGYLDKFFSLGLAIAILLGVVLFVYNGVHYMTSDVVGNKEGAIGNMKSIVGGLVLVFSIWLILNTINPNLVNFNLFRTLAEVRGELGKAPATPPTTVVSTDEEALREMIKTLGIGVNNDPCAAGSSGSGCTNLSGLPGSVFTFLDMLTTKVGDCPETNWPRGCQVTINGGTESGPHKTHGVGIPFVDIAKYVTVVQLVTATGPAAFAKPSADTCLGKEYVVTNQNTWILDEGSHYHICVGTKCRYAATCTYTPIITTN